MLLITSLYLLNAYLSFLSFVSVSILLGTVIISPVFIPTPPILKSSAPKQPDKNKNITIGNILSEHTFVSGTKYWKISSASLEGDTFEVGTRVCVVEETTEYHGNFEWLMIDEYGNVEVSIDNLELGGRVDLEDLVK
jgi:hypothetical protein